MDRDINNKVAMFLERVHDKKIPGQALQEISYDDGVVADSLYTCET